MFAMGLKQQAYFLGLDHSRGLFALLLAADETDLAVCNRCRQFSFQFGSTGGRKTKAHGGGCCNVLCLFSWQCG